MSLANRLAIPLLAVAAVIAGGAAGAESAADVAAALQARMRAWVAELAGPGIDLGGHEVQVTPDGDAYRVELPLTGAVAGTGWLLTGGPVTALVTPQEGGLWAIRSLRLPSPLHADQKTRRGAVPRAWVMTLTDQDISGRLDPGLASGSSFTAKLRGYQSLARTGESTQTIQLDRYAWHGGWEPSGEGRVTVAGEGEGQDLRIVTEPAGGTGRLSVTAERISGGGRMESVAFDRLGAALRTVSLLLPAVMEAAGAASLPDAIAGNDRARLRDLVLILRDLTGGARQETVLEHVRLDLGGQGGTVERLTIGGRAEAPGGMLELSVRLSLEGIDSPLFPQGRLGEYLPRRITLTPRLSGIPADALVSLLLRAIDGGDPETLRAEARELLGKAPITAGLEDLVLDLGAAVLTARASMTATGQDDMAGAGRVVVTGLDALIRRAGSMPELRGLTPFLILLKGVGKPAGDATTWDVIYAAGRAEVNGTDLSALLALPAPPRGRRP